MKSQVRKRPKEDIRVEDVGLVRCNWCEGLASTLVFPDDNWIDLCDACMRTLRDRLVRECGA